MSKKLERTPWARAYLKHLRPYVDGYEPNEHTRDRIKDVDLTIVFGPAGGGKGVHLSELFVNANKFGLDSLNRVLASTTRPRRPSEYSGPKMYSRNVNINDWVVRSQLINKMRQREPVQVIRHPTGELYWTDEDAFMHAPHRNVWEATAAECGRIVRAELFPKMDTVIGIVPINGDEWLKQWRGRDGKNPAGFAERLKEAHQAFSIALHAPSMSDKTVFVVNNYGPIENAPLDYNPEANFEDPLAIPPAFVAMAAILNGEYSRSHVEDSNEIAGNLLAFTGRELKKYGFDPDEVAAEALVLAA